MKNKVATISNDDRETWELLCNVPLVGKACAVICAILNCILPGSGTFVAACYTEDDHVSKVQMSIAVVQFLTTFFLIGWLLSIFWAYLIIVKAFKLNLKS